MDRYMTAFEVALARRRYEGPKGAADAGGTGRHSDHIDSNEP
jgi:hypothetical protein